jgi:hypothetical protein
MQKLTRSDNVVVPRLKRLVIFLNRGAALIPEREGVGEAARFEFDENTYHRVEVGIRDAGAEN